MHRTFKSELPFPFGASSITYCGTEVVPGPSYALDDPHGSGRAYLEEEVGEILLGELGLADASYTGRRTACVIETNRSPYFYGGHVLERAPGDFEAAESMALGKVPSPDETITALYVTGAGVKKPKHVMPSADAYDHLSPRFTDETLILVMRPNTFDAVQVIYGIEHALAYSARDYSEFRGPDVYSSKVEAEDLTPLDELDCEFIAHLRQLGLENDIRFYLTGSASGRGGASNLLDDSYGDLDIIAVSDRPTDDVIDRVVSLGDVFYDDPDTPTYGTIMEPKHVTLWSSGETRDGVCIRYPNKTIDFFPGNSLPDLVVRPEILVKNWFHKLS